MELFDFTRFLLIGFCEIMAEVLGYLDRLVVTIRKIWFLFYTVILMAITCFVASVGFASTEVDDVSGLNKTMVSAVVFPTSENEIQAQVIEARNAGKIITIAGRRHSQGGHVMADDAIMLDLTKYRKILSFDKNKSVLTVEAGATWAQIQDYLEPLGYAVRIQQSSNIFTVGGSLGANIHGRDPRFGPLVESVRSFRIVLADGSIKTVNRSDNSDLFALAIGGYGLFGVITEVSLSVVGNTVLQRESVSVPCAEYVSALSRQNFKASDVEIHYARPDITRDGFFSTCVVTNYKRIADEGSKLNAVQKNAYFSGEKVLFDLSRKSELGKQVRWFVQENYLDHFGMPDIISRNDAMRPPLGFIDYYSKDDADVLQEYFIPLDRGADFLEKIAEIMLENNINLLSATLRYLPGNTETMLSYANERSLAVVLYINHGRAASDVAVFKGVTQKLVDTSIFYGGSYYLTYANYATRDQLKRAYPRFDEFVSLKKKYDPNGVFINKFYQEYGAWQKVQ
ncbi:FAD-binding oxidoreductase [Micavibrio aeruginosavorus]|uniref:FAD-binding oxidoreductase n=1 Tax=Micavibrio aeruginosavorus TaxID=349221 RepID=UPI003F4AE08D